MPISFSSGLVTRGYGENHRIVTRGMAVRFDFGGIRPVSKREAVYDLEIVASVLKTDSDEIGVYSPIEIRSDEDVFINLDVLKEVAEDVNVLGNIDHSSLDEVLNEI